MTTFRELKQYIEDLEVGLAERLDAIDNNLATIKAILSGRLSMDPEFVAESLGLTPAESRVAVALAEGKTACGIAKAVGCKVNTVRWHLRQIYPKLNISTQTQLVRLVLLLPHGTGGARSPVTQEP